MILNLHLGFYNFKEYIFSYHTTKLMTEKEVLNADSCVDLSYEEIEIKQAPVWGFWLGGVSFPSSLQLLSSSFFVFPLLGRGAGLVRLECGLEQY